jgi:hypothetical protein
MDELFQRAAENYPLKDGKGDWQSVAKKLAVADDSKDAVVPVTTKRNKKGIAIILFLCMLVGGSLMFYIFTPNVSDKKLAGKSTVEKGNTTLNKKPGDNNAVIPGNVDEPGPNPSEKIIQNKKGKQRFSGSRSTNIIAGTTDAFVRSNVYVQNSIEIKLKNKSLIKTGGNDFLPDKKSTQERSYESAENSKTAIEENISEVKKAGDLKQPVNANETSASSKNGDKKTALIQRKKGLYIGVITGFDFSKVQSASYDNSGFDAGLLLGYRINHALSLESGIVWNKKNYLSEGKNFDMNEIRSTMPSGMVINNLESNSSLIEIPLKARFDFIPGKRSNIFLTGGVSAYIMTKEKNQYTATVNGAVEKVSGVYKKADYGLPAVTGFSLGYEYNFYKSLNIRIEPFLKIPLQGMGVGKLPVTSAGLQIGITSHLK